MRDGVARRGYQHLLRSEALLIVVILAAHMALSARYAFTTPAWEGYDESGHYGFARYIAVNHSLPPIGQKVAQLDETHQPPLYYWLVAQVVSQVDVSDDRQAEFLWAQNVAAKPDPAMNTIPYNGTGLALRLGRLVSIALSTLAVVCTYFTARALFPRQPRVRLMSTALHAFWPMALFMSGLVNNDNGIALTGSLVLLFSAQVVVAVLNRLGRRLILSGFALGLSCGLATLMKDSAVAQLTFAMFACGVAVVLWLKQDPRHTTLWPLVGALALFTLSAAGVIALGILASDGRTARQFAVASSISSAVVSVGANESTAGVGIHTASEALENLVNANALDWFFRSFFGVFGWGGVSLPDAWYVLARIAACIAAIGVALTLICGRIFSRGRIIFLLVFTALMFAAPAARFGFSAFLPALNGRFALAALGALTILISVGLFALPMRIRNTASTTVLAGVLLVGAITPDVIILPTYSRPPILFLGAQDDIPNPTAITFTNPANGDVIELIGHDFPEGRATRGGYMTVRLFWRTPQPIRERYSLRVEAFSNNGKSLGSRAESEPARGAFDTTKWRPGDVYADTHYLTAWDHTDAPLLAIFRMAWLPADGGDDLTVTCAHREQCAAAVGLLPVSLNSAAQPLLGESPAYSLGDSVDMLRPNAPAAITAGQPLTVSVVWRSKAGNLPMLTAFVHLIAKDGRLVGQADSPPRSGQYPTLAWQRGEIVPDALVIQTDVNLAPGEYVIQMGMYDAETAQRLTMKDGAGALAPDGIATVGTVTVHAHK